MGIRYPNFPEVVQSKSWAECHDCQANGHGSLYEVYGTVYCYDKTSIYVRKMVYIALLQHGRIDEDHFKGDVSYIVAVWETSGVSPVYVLCEDASLGTGIVNRHLVTEISELLGTSSDVAERPIKSTDLKFLSDDLPDQAKTAKQIKASLEPVAEKWPKPIELKHLFKLCDFVVDAASGDDGVGVTPEQPKNRRVDVKCAYNENYWCSWDDKWLNGDGYGLNRQFAIGDRSHQWYEHFLGFERQGSDDEGRPKRVTRGIVWIQ
jgi:hypothetical protein